MVRRRGFTPIHLLLALAAVAIIATGIILTADRFGGNSAQKTANVNCAFTGIQVCPDGSLVGRVPPTCEFAACPEANENTTGNTNASVNSNTSADATMDWNAYTSEVWKLTLRYPSGFVVSEKQGSLFISKGALKENEIGSNNAFFSLLDNQEYFSEDNFRLMNTQDETVIIDGRSYSGTTGTDRGRYEGDSAGVVRNIYFESGTIHIEERPGNETQQFNVLMTANQILSTFQFTDQTAATADWKTYTNIEEGYSLRYPPTWTIDTSSNGLLAVVAPKGLVRECVECPIAQLTVNIQTSQAQIDDDSNIHTVAVGGVTARQGDDNGMSTQRETAIPFKGKFLWVGWPSDETVNSTYDLILSTIQSTTS